MGPEESFVQAAPVNVPTWTGRQGASGITPPPPQRRFGSASRAGPQPLGLPNGQQFGGSSAGVGGGGAAPSSADLLAHLRQRQQQANAAGLNASSNGGNAGDSPEVSLDSSPFCTTSSGICGLHHGISQLLHLQAA